MHTCTAPLDDTARQPLTEWEAPTTWPRAPTLAVYPREMKMCVFSETCRRLFQSICAAVTETTGWGLIPQTFTSHGLEAGRPRSRCQQVQCLLRACFLFSLSVRTWQKGALFFKGTDPVLGAPASLPDHLLIPLHWRLGSICRGRGEARAFSP